MSQTLPLLEVSGSPTERGQAHGETFKELIRDLVAVNFEDMVHGTQGYLTKERVYEIVSTYAGPNRDYAPHLFEEMEGIAEAADVPVEDLLALNGFLELHDYYSDAFLVSGCTSFMVPGDTSGEGALIAQNYDLSSIYAAAAILVKVKNDHAPDALFYTSAGMLGCAGVNEAGIGVRHQQPRPIRCERRCAVSLHHSAHPGIRANRRRHRCSDSKAESIGDELRDMR